MDKMDRMLHKLPEQEPSLALAARVKAVIHRRHRRRQILRWSVVIPSLVCGLWMVSPSWWLSSSDLNASGVPWLVGSLNYLSLESFQVLERLWYGMFSLQGTLGSSLTISVWLGILLLCTAIFFVMGKGALQSPLEPFKMVGNEHS
jgi:hypothetical protein